MIREVVTGNSATNYYYRKNLFGDITAIFNGSGTVVARYAYDAWGNCTILQDTNGMGTLNPFRYRGYYFDTELNLYYLNARYYDPQIGRFISQDDISYLDPETLNGLNLFAYCLNNPVMGYDPDGTWDWNKTFKILAWVALGAAMVAATVFTGGAAGAVAALAVGAAAGGLVGGYMNEADGGSFAAGWVGGAVNGLIQTAGTLTCGYMGTVMGGGIGAGIGTFITESLNCLEQNKKFDLYSIADKSVRAGLSSALTSVVTAGCQFLAKSGVDEIVGGSILDNIPGSVFNEGMANCFSALFGIIDDYLSYKIAPHI